MRAAVPHHWSAQRSTIGHPSARSLLFTVLGEYVLPHDGEAWAATLIRALGAMGVEEAAARQAIARTASDGWLSSERAGRRVRWQLTASGEGLLTEGARRIYGFGGSQEKWDGRWVLLFADEDERLRTRLAWAGFGRLSSGTWIAAHTDREHEARRVLEAAGVRGVSFVASSGEIGDPSLFIRDAWDLDVLEDRYEAFIAAFAQVRPASDADAFVAMTQLVHEWRRFPFMDPGLPAHLLPRRWSGDRARTLFQQRRRDWSQKARRWFDGS